MKKRGLGILVLSLVLGMLAGSLLGELIGVVIPDGVVRDFFLKSITPEFGPVSLDLLVFSVTVGVGFRLNIISLLGIVIAVYYFRWYH